VTDVCSFCRHANRPMAVGPNARICEVCLRARRQALREELSLEPDPHLP
jgi:hypothetical protein